MQLNCTGDFCFNGLALSGADRKRKILQLKILRHLCHVLRGEIAQRQDEAAQDLGWEGGKLSALNADVAVLPLPMITVVPERSVFGVIARV